MKEPQNDSTQPEVQKVAVLAHSGKSLGGGLTELRTVLADFGIREPLWCEVAKSSKAPKRLRAALAEGPSLVIVWGGDGMVQRCVDVLAGTKIPMAIVPAGTANLLATNLGIPRDIGEAVKIALHGVRQKLDVGMMNGECFAVMGGAGLDGRMIANVDSNTKERLGRVAYVRGTVKAMSAPRSKASVRVDGGEWFDGLASCVLVGNVGTVIGGLRLFETATPTDGLLDVGVVSAKGRVEWLRVLGRVLGPGQVEKSPLVQSTKAKTIDVKFDNPVRYEIDGGARSKTRRLKVRVRPGALVVCVPQPALDAAPVEP